MKDKIIINVIKFLLFQYFLNLQHHYYYLIKTKKEKIFYQTNIIALAFLQYFSQDSLNLAYPPRSQSFNYTLPFFIYL